MIEIQNVRKSFASLEVLKGINLTVDKGEVVSIIGGSGSGKSTLLTCINGLEPIQGGSILLDGDVVSGAGVDLVRVRRKVGMVFQSFNLFPHMSVLRNCMLSPVRTGVMGKEEAAAAARTMLDRVGLAAKADSYPDQLSGGQQQRVAIARAMLMNPQGLLLDEITSALDPELVVEVLDLVRELAHGGMTLILATHEMGFAREISNEVCFLADGVIVERGAPEQIFSDPTEPLTQRFLRRVVAARRL